MNKDLQLNINNERILDKLATNLNLSFISSSSNIKKMADTYSAENFTFSNAVNSAVDNLFLSTMDEDSLEKLGSLHGIYRRKYGSISISAITQTVTIEPDIQVSNVNEIVEPLTVFNKGDIIYSNESFMISAASDVIISDINGLVPISVKVTAALGVNSYSIPAQSSFYVSSKFSDVKELLPSFNVKVNNDIGISVVEENIEDYRGRLLDNIYKASNGANSVLSAVTKETPLLTFIETNDFSLGRAVKIIYPYTDELIQYGVDPNIESIVIPLLNSNINNKVMFNNANIDIKTPSPILLNIYISVDTLKVKPTQAYLNNVLGTFNIFFARRKTEITLDTILDYLIYKLNYYSLTKDLFKVEISSPYVSEESYELDSNFEITVPIGRFLHLNLLKSNQELVPNVPIYM